MSAIPVDAGAGPEAARSPGRRWSRALLATVLLSLAVLTAFPSLFPSAEGLPLFDVFVFINGLAVSWLAFLVAADPRVDAGTRKAWRLLGLAFTSYLAGDVTYAFYELRGHTPYPSLADPFYLAFYPLVLWGLFSLPTRHWEPHEKTDFALDMGALLIGGGMIVWITVLAPSPMPQGALEAVFAAVYPLSALLLVLGFTAVMTGQRLTPSYALLAIGLLLEFAGDLLYTPRLALGATPVGAWVGSLVLLFAWSAFGTSAFLRLNQKEEQATAGGPPQGALNVVVQAVVLLGYLVLLAALWAEPWPRTLAGLIVGGVALTAVVLVRQGRAVRDNLTLAAGKESEARFRSLVKNASDVVLVVDPRLQILYGTPSAEDVLDWRPSRAANLSDFLHPDSQRLAESYVQDLARGTARGESTEWRLQGRDGWLAVEVKGANLLEDPHVKGLVLTARSVDERKRLEAELARQALYDALTGLANRLLFADRLDQALLSARRRDTALSVLLVDLDDFRDLNDSLGHGAGDRILVRAARRIESCLAGPSTVARLGSDEFAVLLEDQGWAGATEAARAIHAALGEIFDEQGRNVRLDASIGIAVATQSESASELLRNADLALHETKRVQKGSHRLFEPVMHAAAVSRLESLAALHRAHERGEFRLLYQPIVELASGRVAGVEALLRWDSPEKGPVNPSDFIPLAEETGFVGAIGDWVISEALANAAGWEGAAASPPYLSLNVSTRQLHDADFVRRLDRALEGSSFRPERLALEITESRLMSSPELGMRVLRDLKSLGVTIAIDDFGTGYSSLAYLRSLPVDLIKIDQSFARVLDRDERSLRLVQGILDLARALGLGVVAEGVERREQVLSLVRLACPHAQGFFFARPLRATAVAEALATPVAVLR
jgi:diguanylate cyclase (GGDEF)-like protein/PAS domain S-box-containing protein